MPVAGIFLLSEISNLGFVVQYYLIFFFSLFRCQKQSDSVEVGSSEKSVCFSLIVFCLLYFPGTSVVAVAWFSAF